MLHQIVSLWVGPSLGPIEQMCLRSFVTNGHPTALYAYGDVAGVPGGVELRDAARIVRRESLDAKRSAGWSPTLFANYFRLLLQQGDAGLWVDTDVVCLRPITVAGPFVAGWESDRYINNAVLRLAPTSPVLRDALLALESGRVPRWTPLHRAPLQRVKSWVGLPVSPGELPRGSFGPKGITALAARHGLSGAAQPPEVFYPLHPRDAERLYDPALTLEAVVTERTLTLHLWNEKLATLKRAPPPRGSIMARLLEC